MSEKLRLSDLIKEQGTAREFENPGHAQASEPIGGGEPFYHPEDMAGEPEHVDVSETSARAQARMAARLLDGMIGNGLAAYAKETDSSQFRASNTELQDIEEDWYEVTKKRPLPITPELKLAITYMGTYWKYFDSARFKKEINDLKRKQEDQEARIRKMEEKQTP